VRGERRSWHIQCPDRRGTVWTLTRGASDNLPVSRYTFPCYNVASTPRYVVVWDLQWQMIDCQRLEPATDLSGAMAAAIELLEDHGWHAEATPEYGFVFVRKADERRLLMLTSRDPHSTAPQSFSPFSSEMRP
jgi:hypothetical protein